MIAEVAIPHDWDIPRIVSLSGGTDHSYNLSTGVLRVYGVDQAALDAAVAQYDHLALLRGRAREQIDRAAESVRADWVSPGSYIAVEYEQAEAAARAFAAAGYPADTVPDEVAAWAEAAGITSEAAADDIISTAEQWREAVRQIRRTRLLGKAAVDAATDADSIAAAVEAAINSLNKLRPESKSSHQR